VTLRKEGPPLSEGKMDANVALTILEILVACIIFLAGFLTGIFVVIHSMRGILSKGEKK